MRWPSVLLLAGILCACSKPLPSLEGVDLVKWKDDKNGCLGNRQGMEMALTREMEKLKGLSEMDIIGMLGRPDENELYKRNQKFFFYYIQPGPHCDVPAELPHKLMIRFNAMGYAQLVSIGTVGQ